MFQQIISFLLEVVTGLLSGACLLRLYMQHQRVGFGNPIGRFIFAVTDWIVLPLRKLLPSIRKIDTASLVAAYLFKLAQFLLLWLLVGRTASIAVVPLVAAFALLRLVLSGAMILVIVYAVLSWVRADSPMSDLLDRLVAPMLRPFRKLIPLVGGIDLTPLVLIVLLQVGQMIVASIERSVFS